MKKWCIWGIIVLVAVCPMVIAGCIIGQVQVLKCIQTSNDWIGFLGCYIGAVVTSVAAYGLWILQRDSDRKQGVLPIVNVCQINGERPQAEANYYIDYLYWQGVLSGCVLRDPQHADIKSEVEKNNRWLHTCILVESIGKGPVMNMHVDIQGNDYIKALDKFAICIREGECAKYDIYIEADRLIKHSQENELIFRFKDVYDHCYKQRVKFGLHDINGNKKNSGANNEDISRKWQLTYFEPISSVEEDSKKDN